MKTIQNCSNFFLKALVLALLVGGSAHAEISVIAHPDNSEASLSATQVKKIFLGKSKSYPGGAEAIAIDYQAGNAMRSTFYSSVIGKTEAQAKAYWSKRVFTGKGSPPKAVASEADVIELVSGNPNTMGYVDSGSVDGSVKVLLTIP